MNAIGGIPPDVLRAPLHTHGRELCFTQTALGQRQIHAAAKPRGLNPCNVAVSNQYEARHLSVVDLSTSPCTRKSAIVN